MKSCLLRVFACQTSCHQFFLFLAGFCMALVLMQTVFPSSGCMKNVRVVDPVIAWVKHLCRQSVQFPASSLQYGLRANQSGPPFFHICLTATMRSTCLKLANQKARGFQLSRDKFWQEMRVSSCEDGVYSFSSAFTKVVFYT